jgi:hypothetical protein
MPTDLEAMREWLIMQGIPAKELDEIEPLPVIDDYGNALAMLLTFVNALGDANAELLQMIQDQQAQVNDLRTELEAIKNA